MCRLLYAIEYVEHFQIHQHLLNLYQHKFFDLKYNMQHLLARVLFKQNSRASLKYLDGVINDVEA